MCVSQILCHPSLLAFKIDLSNVFNPHVLCFISSHNALFVCMICMSYSCVTWYVCLTRVPGLLQKLRTAKKNKKYKEAAKLLSQLSDDCSLDVNPSIFNHLIVDCVDELDIVQPRSISYEIDKVTPVFLSA